MRCNFSNIWTVSCFSFIALFPFAQIIYRIKKHKDPSITANIEDICDRIFVLVDKNKDSKFWADDINMLLINLSFLKWGCVSYSSAVVCYLH